MTEIGFQDVLNMINDMTPEQRVKVYNVIGETIPDVLLDIEDGRKSALEVAEDLFSYMEMEGASAEYLDQFNTDIIEMLQGLDTLPQCTSQFVGEYLENDDKNIFETMRVIDSIGDALNVFLDRYYKLRTDGGFRGPRISDPVSLKSRIIQLMSTADDMFDMMNVLTRSLAVLTALRKHI